MKASAGKRGRKVLIIVENLPVPFDRRVWMEATTLRRAGYEVSVICPATKDFPTRYEEIEGIHVYRHPLPLDARLPGGFLVEYAVALFWQFALAWRVLLTRGFDVIHACNPPDLIFLVGGFFKLVFRKKFVFDHHDLCPELYEAKFAKRDFFWRLLRFAEKLTFRTADMSVATNESYRKVAIERGGMEPDKVHVVRSGPDLSRFTLLPPNPELRRGKSFLVGYVGVLGHQEGIDLLLEAVDHTVRKLGRRDILFTVVGGGPELENLRRQSREMGLEEFVHFTGRVPDRDLLEVLSTADVCVNADRYSELNDKSTMNKILEYMALSKPIVQFDCTEGRYSAGEASVYARPDDPADLAARIVELIDDPERRAEMGRIGRTRMETQLSWGHQSVKLLAAYDSLFGAASTAGARSQELPIR